MSSDGVAGDGVTGDGLAGAANSRTGIMLMLAAMFMFTCNDVLGKYLVGHFAVGQVVLVRSLAALVILVPFAFRGGIRPVIFVPRPGLHALRSVLMAIEGFGFYAAVAYLPLADTVTYWLAAPIYVAAMASVFLGERVDWRGWAAILLGFVGVVVALNPSSASLTGPALIALSGSACFAVSMVIGRQLRSTPDPTMMVWQMGAAVVSGALALWLIPGSWRGMSLFQTGQLCILGVVALAAHVMTNRSLKHAPAAVVMPFQYSLLPWAMLFGAIFFADRPTTPMLAGSALIVAAGLYIALRKPLPRQDGQPYNPVADSQTE